MSDRFSTRKTFELAMLFSKRRSKYYLTLKNFLLYDSKLKFTSVGPPPSLCRRKLKDKPKRRLSGTPDGFTHNNGSWTVLVSCQEVPLLPFRFLVSPVSHPRTTVCGHPLGRVEVVHHLLLKVTKVVPSPRSFFTSRTCNTSRSWS